MSEIKKTAKPAAEPIRYSKEALAASRKYADRQDLVSALLEDGKSYSFEEADGIIKKYLEGGRR